MLLSGLEIITRKLILNIRSTAHQQQPCGVDLTLRHISKWTSSATLDYTNTKRKAARTAILPFQIHQDKSEDKSTSKSEPNNSISTSQVERSIFLPAGSYLIDFHESIKVPLDLVAFIHPRSSLWRSGVSISAGVIDSGYEGALGGLLDVKNPEGVRLFEGAKIAQAVFEGMEGSVEGYKGVYQGSLGIGEGMGSERKEL